jgi:hypothetical protein
MRSDDLRNDFAIRLAMQLEDSSDWLRDVLDSACDLDPELVLADLQRAVIAFSSIVERRRKRQWH